MIAVDIVIESRIDGRADGKFGARVQVLQRLRQNVGAGVAQREEAFLVFLRIEFHMSAVCDRFAQIGQFAVDACCDRILCEAVGDLLRCFKKRHSAFKVQFFSVFQKNLNHDSFPSVGIRTWGARFPDNK